jgi:hypothetical protein
MAEPKKPALRLPKKITCVALHGVLAGVVACTGHAGPAADASTGHDAASDCDGGQAVFCGSGSCPEDGAYYCLSMCPTDCEPFS